MSKLLELKEKWANAVGELRALNEKSGFTEADQRAFDAKLAEVNTLERSVAIEEKHEETEKTHAARLDAEENQSRAVPSTQWRTSKGDPISVVRHGESLVDAQTRAGILDHDAAEKNGSLGLTIRGMITGQWDGAERERRALALGNDTTGGYLLSPFHSSQLVDLARNKMRVSQAGARILDMPTSEMILAKVTSDPTPAWRTENSSVAESSAALGAVKFTAKSLAIILKLSRELAADAANAGALIESMLATVMALEIDRAALLGDGAGPEPTGIVETTGVLENGSIGALKMDDFLDSIGSLRAVNCEPNAVIYSSGNATNLSKLKDGEGNYLTPPEEFAKLLRLDSNQLPNSTAVMGDYSNLLIGTRQRIEIEVSKVNGLDTLQVWVVAHWRGDIQLARPNHFLKMTGIS